MLQYNKAGGKALFQSTLPRRERLIAQGLAFTIQKISIHTPTKGATYKLGDQAFLFQFQSTLPRRERRYTNIVGGYICNFNPHSHEGSDFLRVPRQNYFHDFNPHSHEGSDYLMTGKEDEQKDFNPHSHEGSDCNINQ